MRDRNRQASGGAIAGAGGTVAAAGLAGGGVPGVRASRLMADVQSAPSRTRKAGTLARAYGGGEFGYRTNAHRTFSNFNLAGGRTGATRAAHYEHGIKTGKLAAEEKVIRQLKTGRRASTAALLGGTGAAIYGVRRAQGKKTFGKADRRDKSGISTTSGALLGAGGTAAGLSYGGEKLAGHAGKKWITQGLEQTRNSTKIVPRPYKMNPGTTKSQAELAGHLKGQAAQARYFGRTYLQAGKIAGKLRRPSLAAAGVGAAGLAGVEGKKAWSRRNRVQKAMPEFVAKPAARAFRPRSVAQGQRIRQATKGAHKARPKVGHGAYVKAPLLRDKLTSPRWMANAVVNNPGNVVAGGAGLGGGALLVGDRKRFGKADDRNRNRQVAGGALVGGGAAHFARTGADYGTKALAEHQFKPLTTKGNYGPYREGPHKAALNKYKRTARGDPRTKAMMFDQNFPKGIPSYRARRAGVILNKKPVVAGAVLGGAALGGAAMAARRHRINKRTMGQPELQRRRQLQGNIGRTTSTLGLIGTGLAGGAALAAKKKGVLTAIRKVPKLGGVTPEKMRNAALSTGIVSGGIGGVGGFNQASIYSAEAKQRKKPVVKSAGASSMGIETGYFGDEGRPVALDPIETEIAKDWSPVATNYNPESLRHGRNRKQQTALTAASGATGAGALAAGGSAARGLKNLRPGQIRARNFPTVKAAQAARRATAVKHGKLAAGLAGASAATGLGAALVNQRRKSSSWASYEKRLDEIGKSAFGIDHEVNKVFPRRAAKVAVGPSTGQLIRGQLNRLGEAHISLKGVGSGTGKTVSGAGRLMQAHPGVTGAALVGGGGTAGYRYVRQQPPMKKKTRKTAEGSPS